MNTKTLTNLTLQDESSNHGVVVYGRLLTVEDGEQLKALQQRVVDFIQGNEAPVALVVPAFLEDIDDVFDQACVLGTVLAAAPEGKQPVEIAPSTFESLVAPPAILWGVHDDYDHDGAKLYLVPCGWCGTEVRIGDLDEEAIEDHQIFGDDDEPTGELDPNEWDEGSIDGEDVAIVSSEDTYCYVELDADTIAQLTAATDKILMHCYYI